MSRLAAWRASAGCLTVVLGLLAAAGSATAAASAPTRSARHVLLVGVPGLRWIDITAANTPFLWRLAGEVSVGAMSVRADSRDTRRGDGWLTVSSGNRARAYADSVDPLLASASLPDPGRPDQLRAVVALNRRSSFRARVGALGGALHDAGLRTAALGGDGARLAAMDSAGMVDVPAVTVAEGLRSADLVVDELPAAYAPQPGPARDAAVRLVDGQLAAAAGALARDDLLLVIGVSDSLVGASRLSVAMARGPGFERRWLSSESTRHEPLVQLVDVAPTVLRALGQPAPSTMVGGAWTSGGPRAASSRSGPAVDRLVGLTDRSWAQSRLSAWFPSRFSDACLVFAAVVAAVWWRGRNPLWLRPAALTAGALPVSAWLVQLLPWWRWGLWSVPLLTVAWAVLVGQVAHRGPWRRRPWGPAGAVGLFSALVIAVDVVTGSRLELDAPFGDNPVVAGRFHGIGNAAFAVLAAGTLVGATALAASRRRLAAATVVGLVGLAAVVVDGMPFLGDDLGGVVALAPAVLLLAVLFAETRVNALRASAVVGITGALAVGFALYDYALPTSRRSHLGRFVQQLRDGTGWTIVHRKLHAAEQTLTSGSFRWVALVAVLLGAVAWMLLRRHRLAVVAGEQRRLASLVASLVVVGLLGAALNDSGLAITALAWSLGGPLLLLVLTAAPRSPEAPLHT